MRRIATILLLICCVHAWAQKPFIKDYLLNDANTATRINALMQDNIGYIWIGTNNGLVCFNGRTFTKIQDSTHQSVTALTLYHNEVLAGYNNGIICKVTNGVVKPMNINHGPTSAITSLHVSVAGALWASTEEQGVFVVKDKDATALNATNGLSDNFTYDIAINANGTALVGSDIGINDVTQHGNKFNVTVYTTRQGLPDNIISVIKDIANTDLYWIGTQQSGIVVYDNKSKRVIPVMAATEKWIYGQVNDILPVSATRAWIATESGYMLEVEMQAGKKFAVHPYYYANKSFKKLLLDKAGNIWCGTATGLSMMTGEYLSQLEMNAPYSLQDITAMTWNNDILWVALKKELYHVYLKDAVPHLVKVYTAKAKITSLYDDKDGRLWIGTLGDGLYYQKSKYDIARVEDIDNLKDDDNILTIAGTPSSLWVAGLKGVDELSYPVDGKITLLRHHGKKTGIGSDYVYQLYPDRKGNIWMATDGAGVCKYDGSTYYHWDAAFSSNGKVAYSVAEDVYGDMWAGTMYKDLYHFHNNAWQNLRVAETQYPDINISAVMANATGQVVSVYQRCIDEWYPQSKYFRHFNSALGLGIDSTSNVLNCTATDRDGNMYVPYQKGILVFRNQNNNYDIRPTVHIAGLSVFSKPVAADKHLFGYDENYVGLAFDGIGYADHERLNYRYMLEGYNDDWIYTNDAAASFPKLQPGKYKFRVQVSLNPAFDHPGEDTYLFTIATPFWNTNLFYFVVVALAVVIGYGYIKQREKRLQRIALLQQERMMFEYEHLKSQVNPHFLFNSLYALSILIEEKKENALSYTIHLADLYRNMLSSGRKDIIYLKEELDILNNYTSIQQTRFEETLHIKIDIPEELKETKKVVPLALQLLVENAIKHNVVSAALPLTITITATKDRITVSNKIQPKMSKEKSEGIGLVNIKKRYGLLTKEPITYGIFEGEYIVTLPLL